ncbi:MAG: hypothetical protein C5B49_03865 [Bdellovibrio sp.]|nr:MAG: hypothetical protein C5B49_03865 [Bdellovibrio sp.]
MKYSHSIVLGAALFSLALWSQEEKIEEKQTITVEELLSRLHHANQDEISAGKLAKEKGTSKAVKDFGNHLVKEHRKADKLVTDLAAQKGVKLGAGPKSARDAGQVAKGYLTAGELKVLSGEKFDDAFLKSMKTSHEDIIHLLESAETDDLQARKLIDRLLPDLKTHLSRAEALEATEATKKR